MRVRFTQEARDDIASIHAYIAQHDASAAGRVVAAIEYSTKRLADFPFSGRAGAVEATRELVIPHLPYILVYVVTADIEVVAVFHTAQDRPRG